MVICRNILIFSLLLLLAGCQVAEQKLPPPETSAMQVIKLEAGLGTVSIDLPVRYDTTFRWIHYSDCGQPCEKRKYRFQPRILPVYKETGFHFKSLDDSIEQFTIVHNPYINASDSAYPNNKEFIYSFHDHKKFEVIHDPALQTITADTIEKIGDRYFSIIVIDIYDAARKEYSKKILSTSTIKRGVIEFNFELLTKQKDSLTQRFVDEAKYYLRTIRINSGT